MRFVCFERALYWALWTGAILYSLYKFAKKCQQQQYLLENQQDLKEGTLSHNLYDASDFEWQTLKTLYQNNWYIVMIHFIISNIFVVYNKPEVRTNNHSNATKITLILIAPSYIICLLSFTCFVCSSN